VISMELIKLGRIAIAAVWLYHGVWNKLLAPVGRHASIVATAADLGGWSPRTTLALIGVGEVLLAVWVLSGTKPRWAAIAQTLVLVAMNAGGLLWARDQIADPGGMIVQNCALLVLIWIVALASPTAKNHV
jgi:uncharacterized membrane protein YphA (DoxX/SURF4 family)